MIRDVNTRNWATEFLEWRFAAGRMFLQEFRLDIHSEDTNFVFVTYLRTLNSSLTSNHSLPSQLCVTLQMYYA